MKKTILSKRFLHSVLLTLAFCLPVLPAFAQEDIVDRLDKALGVTLPSEYQSKLKTFVQSSLVFKDKDASELTEQFIKDEMKKDWGISKQSQLLFIWTALNEKINGEFLYEGSDGNENRLEEFASIMNTYDDCGKRYETAFRAHTKQRSEEAKQRSAEYEQRSAEAKQQSAEAELKLFIKFINDYNDFINKHKDFIDKNAVEDAYVIISKYKEKIGELQKRLENPHVALQNSQILSADETEAIKQLLSDIGEQRAAMFKQRLVVVEKNYAAIEKKIAETQQKIASAETINDGMLQKINEAKEAIVKAKQNIDKAKTNNSENSLTSAEINLISAEADRRSAEADRRSAEAVQTSNMITYYGLYQITSYYQLRGVAPESETTEPNEFWKHVKEYWEHVANNCEKFNIDYRSLLPLEVQKFYGIQPTRQNNLTCEKAMNQTLNYTIKELAKLYNLYQQAPQAEREIDKKSANYIIEDCKKRNIDYRAILLKELGDKKKVDDLLKLFGVE